MDTAQTSKSTSGNVSKSSLLYWLAKSRPLWINLGMFSAVVTLIVAAVWGSNNRTGMLTVPSWKSNVFSWHPILMTTGFFFSQTLAILPWNLTYANGPIGGVVALWSLIWNTIALATLITALYAVFKYRDIENKTNLNTIHEWIGILIAILFFLVWIFSILFALGRYLLAANHTVQMHSQQNPRIPNFVNQFGEVTKFLALLVYALTAANIFSGLVQRQGTCVQNMEKYTTWPQYGQMPQGCHISGGIGILVLLTTILTFMVVLSTYKLTVRDFEELSPEKQSSAHARQLGDIQTGENAQSNDHSVAAVSTTGNGSSGHSSTVVSGGHGLNDNSGAADFNQVKRAEVEV